MIKKILVVSFLFLFAMQFVLAQDTEIKIKTPEFTEIHLTVLDPDADYSAFAIYKKTSDAYGDAVFIYSGDALVFDLMVVLKKSDKTISSEKYRNNYVAGESVYLEVIPNGYEIRETPTISGNTIVNENVSVSNSTEKNTTAVAEPETSSNITEEAPKNNSNFLSFFLKSEGDKQTKEGQSSKGLYYIGALVLLLGIGFFIFKSYQTPTPRKIKVTKLSEVQPKAFDSKNVNELIGDASDRIKKAQKEIETLKKYKG
ncbi:MAG: hypothetical protein AABX80_01845 [Nanoarchaeota archaeon]